MAARIADKLLQWLEWALQTSTSNLHVIAEHPPVIRLHVDLIKFPKPPLTAAYTKSLLLS